MKKFIPLITLPLLAHSPLFACCSYEYEGMLINTGEQLLSRPEGIFSIEVGKLAPKAEFPRKTTLISGSYAYNKVVGVNESEAWAGLLEAHLRKENKPQETIRLTVEAYRAYRQSDPKKERPAIPDGLPAGFAAYETGAALWHEKDFTGAAGTWARLLTLPAGERSPVEAATHLMLAKHFLTLKDEAATKRHIEALRACVRAGAPDPVGYAAYSYQLERHLARDNWEVLENLLVQAGAEMDSEFIEFHLRRHCTALLAEAPKEETGALVEKFRNSMRDHPRVRRLIGAYLVSVGGLGSASNLHRASMANWIRLLDGIPGPLEEYSKIAASSYSFGEYKMAEKFVSRAPVEDPLAALVASRLSLRQGSPDSAAKSLSTAVPENRILFSPREGRYTGRPYKHPRFSPGFAEEADSGEFTSDYGEQYYLAATHLSRAAGELGVLRLLQGNHAAALDLFLRAGLDRDAAVVAERFLKTEELIAIADKPRTVIPYKGGEEIEAPWHRYLRSILARRLMREGRPDEAAGYFDDEERKTFDRYRELSRTGYDSSAAPEARANAFLEASELIADHGTVLFKSVTGPLQANRKFFDPDMSADSGIYREESTEAGRIRARIGEGTVHPLPEIRDRIMRFRAGELALYAASLLPNNNDTSAYMLWRAGERHAVAGDERSADVFYKLICLRHPETTIGKAALKKRWFPYEGDEKSPAKRNPPGGK